jgi:hypothetical protein
VIGSTIFKAPSRSVPRTREVEATLLHLGVGAIFRARFRGDRLSRSCRALGRAVAVPAETARADEEAPVAFGEAASEEEQRDQRVIGVSIAVDLAGGVRSARRW